MEKINKIKQNTTELENILEIINALPNKSDNSTSLNGLSIVASGKCGDNVDWVLYEGGTAIITGSGSTYDYTSDTSPFETPIDDLTHPGHHTKNVIIQEGITGLGKYLFWNNENILSVFIPSSIINIEHGVFDDCYDEIDIYYCGNKTKFNQLILNANLPEHATLYCNYTLQEKSVTENGTVVPDLGYDGLSSVIVNVPTTDGGSSDAVHLSVLNCTVTQYDIPSTFTEVRGGLFYGCSSLTSVTIPDSVTKIGDYAFYGCSSLTSANIPNGVTRIGTYAFHGCQNLTSVNIPNGITNINAYTFGDCFKLANITIPNSVKSIGVYSFFRCRSFTNITIPNSVTSISSYAFQHCSNLTSVTIPDSVTSISSYAFQGCVAVKEYDFTSWTDVPTLSNTNAFGGIASDCVMKVPTALYNSLITATNWSTYASYMVAV